jgi:hypothetical protein
MVLYVAHSMCLQQPSFLTRRLQSENCVPKALQMFKPKEMHENGVIIITGDSMYPKYQDEGHNNRATAWRHDGHIV